MFDVEAELSRIDDLATREWGRIALSHILDAYIRGADDTAIDRIVQEFRSGGAWQAADADVDRFNKMVRRLNRLRPTWRTRLIQNWRWLRAEIADLRRPVRN